MIVGLLAQFFTAVQIKIFSKILDFIFGLFVHIRATISKVKVGKWMIVGPVAQFL